MKFMDKNKDFVQVGDDFEILIRNKPIPGSDFIEIMNYLQQGSKAREHTLIPTRDLGTGMPICESMPLGTCQAYSIKSSLVVNMAFNKWWQAR